MLRMKIFLLAGTRLRVIRNEHVRGKAQVKRFDDEVEESWLRWFIYVGVRGAGYNYREKNIEFGHGRQVRKRTTE